MLNIARTIYAGWDTTNQKYELPEAEVIPFGESTNEKKKLTNIANKYPMLYEHDNIPLPGFTLHKTDRKNWGSIDQTWLVIDPRGFLVRISSKNLEDILHVTGITEGLIQQKCVWARENTETKMTLVPVSSTHYLDAVEGTELIEGKVDMKDVQIGDTVLLLNKLQGIYMGVVSLYGPIGGYSRIEEYKPQAFLRRQVIEVDNGKFHYQTDLKILKVIKKTTTPITREDAVKKMNSHIATASAFFSNTTHMTGTYYGTSGRIKLVSTHAVPKVPMTFEEITKDEAAVLFNNGLASWDFGMLLMENLKEDKFLVDYPYIYAGQAPATINTFEVSRILPCDLEKTEKITLMDRRKSIWGSNKQTPGINSLDHFEKFYRIVKNVKNQTYI